MRRVIFSDAHIHNYKRFSTIDDNGRNSRVVVVLDAINSILNYCNENNITEVDFLGDLFHARGVIQADVFNDTYLALEQFRKNDIHLNIVLGNHDLITRNSNRHIFETFHNIAYIIDKPRCFTDSKIAYVPYMDDIEEVRNFLLGVDKDFSVFGHLGTWKTEIGSHDYLSDSGIPVDCLKDFKLVVLGHYHKRQQIPETNIHFVGSLVQTTFGECVQERGFFDVEDGGVNFVSIKSPKFITFNVDEIDDVSQLVEGVEGNYVRITGHEGQVSVSARDTIEKHGAKAVVFNTIQDSKPVSRLSVDELKTDVDGLIESYASKFKEDLDEARLVSIGKLIAASII